MRGNILSSGLTFLSYVDVFDGYNASAYNILRKDIGSKMRDERPYLLLMTLMNKILLTVLHNIVIYIVGFKFPSKLLHLCEFSEFNLTAEERSWVFKNKKMMKKQNR